MNRHQGNPINRRWWILGLLAVAEWLAMSLWMTASAVTGQLADLWSLSIFQTGMLTTAVQIGFVGGTAFLAFTNIADLFDTRKLFALCAVGAALSNACLIICDGFGGAVCYRFLTGFFLAVVYPPGMKMISTWFSNFRGLAIGSLVGAITIGKATPYMLKLIGSDWQPVVAWSSVGAILAAGLVFFFYVEGPNQFSRKPFSWSLVAEVLRHRPTRLATMGYLGHMWELYAMWTWVPTFLAAAALASGNISGTTVDIASFATIAAGSFGCVAGGLLADKLGRARIVNISMLTSGICCLLVGLAFGFSFWLVVALTFIWGVFVVADSAQFSAMVTEVAPQHAVGTALSLQTSLGFLLTTITIQVIPMLEQAVGWRYAFAILGLGPAFGIWAIARFAALDRSSN